MSPFPVSSIIVILLLNGLANSAESDEDISTNYTFEMPKACARKNLDYCFVKDDMYPEEIIKVLMEEVLETVKGELTMAGRIGNLDETDVDCTSIIYRNDLIYYIVDNNSTVRVVVQLPEFQQLYDIAECKSEGRIGDTPHFDISSNIHFHCENSRIPLSLYSLSLDWTRIEKVQVRNGIPVCCACRYKGPVREI